MLSVHQGARFGLVAQSAVVAGLVGAGLGVVGAIAGLAHGVATVGLLVRALRRAGAATTGPADLVTLVRAAFVGGVAALVADSFVGSGSAVALTSLAGGALVLDGLDGRVARNTGTVSEVGARFDMEVDSVLVFLLSLYVAASLGLWVLAIGSAHYVLVVARRGVAWLRSPVPPRYWCKVVAVVQGVVLATAASGALPRPVAVLALVVVAALLAESFGREAWWRWRSSRAGAGAAVEQRTVGPVHA